MIVAGIDPSLTSAGVAILANGLPEYLGRFGFPGHNGANYQSRSRRIRKQVQDVIRVCRGADLAVIEEHPYAIRVSASEFDRSGLWHGIYGSLDALNIPVAVVSNSTAKKWATGKGNAGKSDVMAAINEQWSRTPLWPGIDCDDISDALALAAMGAHHLGEPMPFELKPRHTTILEVVQWPELAA